MEGRERAYRDPRQLNQELEQLLEQIPVNISPDPGDMSSAEYMRVVAKHSHDTYLRRIRSEHLDAFTIKLSEYLSRSWLTEYAQDYVIRETVADYQSGRLVEESGFMQITDWLIGDAGGIYEKETASIVEEEAINMFRDEYLLSLYSYGMLDFETVTHEFMDRLSVRKNMPIGTNLEYYMETLTSWSEAYAFQYGSPPKMNKYR